MRQLALTVALLAFGCEVGASFGGTYGGMMVNSGEYVCSSTEYGVSHRFETKASGSDIRLGFGGEPSTFSFVDMDTGRKVRLMMRPGEDWECVARLDLE